MPQCMQRMQHRFQTFHQSIPYLRAVPLPALGIISALVFANLVLWAAVGVVLVSLLPPQTFPALMKLNGKSFHGFVTIPTLGCVKADLYD